jgi:hypothetical protein
METKVLMRVGVLGSFVALLAGCAGDESISKMQYVSELDEMCEDFREREKEIGDPQTVADLVEKGPRILDAFDEAILDKVRTLKAPDEIAGEADRLVELADQQHDVISELIAAANDNDPTRVRELASMNAAVNEETKSIARGLGAEACARDAS